MLAVVGSFVCCSVVVLFACVVLLCVLFEPFKVVGVVVYSVVIIARLVGVVVSVVVSKVVRVVVDNL